MKNILKYFFYTIIIIFLWEILHFCSKNSAIPSFFDIIKVFIEELLSKYTYKHIFSTLKILFLGIFISFIVSQALSFLVDNIKTLKGFVCYFIDIFRTIPSIALFPLIIAILGIGDKARIFIIVLISTPAMFLSTIKELSCVDKSVLMASSLDCGKLKQFFYIKYPLSLKGVFNGLQIGIGNGFVAVIVAEMLGASKGVGYMVLWATNAFQYSKAYAYILLIIISGVLFNFVINVITKKINKKVGVL